MKSKFFCDIQGTFTSVESNKTREELLEDFLRALNKLDTNEVEFSFLSGENLFTVLYFISELREHLNNKNLKITMGNHYSGENVYKNGFVEKSITGKIGQMTLELKDKMYKTVYFADDSKLTCEMAEAILQKVAPNSKIVVFNPNDNGLESLNQALVEYEKNMSLVRVKKDE